MMGLLARLALPQGLSRLLWYLGGALIVVALMGGLWGRGNHYRDQRDAANSALTATEANYRAAAATRKASDIVNVQRVDTVGAAISQETIHAYNDRLAALRADFAERVRRATAANSGGASGADLSGVSPAASGPDAGAGEAQLPIRDALIASEQAEQLVALQSWVRKAAAIDVNGNPPPP